MSIIDEQNILGNPALAQATRPGSDVLLSDYAFGGNAYEQQTYEMMGNARGGSWTQPTSYAADVAQAEVEGEPATVQVGPVGEPTSDDPTQYGTQGGQPLSENDESTTKLGQVAVAIAGDDDPKVSIVDPWVSSMESFMKKEEGVQGPVASGGDFNGFEADNQYTQNPQANGGAGATTDPEPIKSTGLGAVVNQDGDPTPPPASNNNDAPDSPGGKASKKWPNNTRKKRNRTTGASAKRTSITPSDAPGGRSSKKRVHKKKGAPLNPEAGMGSLPSGNEDQM